MGFNLLLVPESPDDLYGQWRTLHVRRSGISMSQDHRKEPYPFEIGDLPRELQLIGAIHVHKVDVAIFSQEMFNPLIDELV